MISLEEYFGFLDGALDGMATVLEQLGDELANTAPDVVGANSPFAILTHCLGVMEYWGGHVIAGRPDHRDRAAEFSATGQVEDLIARMRVAREQLETDLADLDPHAPPLMPPEGGFPTQGTTLTHVYRELAQHLGHMEITADLLRAAQKP